MTLTAADVAEIMRLVENSKFDELNLEIDGVKLSLRRSGTSGGFVRGGASQSSAETNASGVQTAAAADTSRPAGSGSAASGAAAAERVAAGQADAGPAGSSALDANLRDITSPMLGTFYRAPKPGSAPFVELGSRVEEDSVIAIIEVMKLMNTVRAGVSGVVTEILTADESLVEFGQVLMRARVDA